MSLCLIHTDFRGLKALKKPCRSCQRDMPCRDGLVSNHHASLIMPATCPQVLQVGNATQAILESQLQICFRFGVAATTDPQLWWDAHQYAMSRGCVHGLVDFMAGAPIALPLTDGRAASCHNAMSARIT